MSIFGLHAFALTPAWNLARIEPQMDRLKEHGIGLMGIPLLRPHDIDTSRTRSFATHYKVDLFCSLGAPRMLDMIERADEAHDYFEQAFKVCDAVGSEMLGGITCSTVQRTTGQTATRKEIDAVCRFLERAAKAARQRGLKLGLKPCNRYETHLLNRTSDTARIIERVGAENLVIHLDTHHMHIEEESFAAGFEAAAPYLGYVTVSEANRGVPGRGMLDWPACMKAIADIGYNGPITFEGIAENADAQAAWPMTEDPRDMIEVGLPFLRQAAREAKLELG